MLTPKQKQLLIFIQDRLAQNGISPSFDEMKEALGLKSKSGIHRLVQGLEERGFIRRLPNRARALEVLRIPSPTGMSVDPENTRAVQDENFPPVPSPATATPTLVASSDPTPFSVVSSHPPLQTQNKQGQDSRADNDYLSLPLYGQIAAGTPIEALQDPEDRIEVSPSQIGRGTHYALRVSGDSMIEAGILDGDIVIIQECKTAENGEIVVALVDHQEATLKKIRKKGQTIALEPANSSYETRIFGADRVQVQGKLVSLIRHYH